MMIAARNAFLMSGAKLPYDSEVEYLESTGTQWIDTEYVYTDTSVFSADVMLTVTPSDTFAAMFGSLVTSANNSGVALFLNNTVPVQARYGDSSVGNIVSNISVQAATGVRHVYTLAQKKLTIDNSDFTRSGFRSYLTSRPVFIFACNDPQNFSRRPIKARFYSFRIIDSGIIVRDFIPVRVGSGASAVGYLYDRANPTGGPLGNGLYPNAGTGAFVIGPDK